MRWRPTLAAVAMLFVSRLQASEPACGSSSRPFAEPPTESILVPVTAYGLVGANGSVWDTDLWVTNTTNTPIIYYFAPCSVSCCCDEFNTFAPQATGQGGGDSPRGQWYRVPADGSLQIQARFRDRTRSAYWAGVELPIVRERDFRRGDLQLIAVPRDGRFRVTLRVYALTAGVLARVEQLDANGSMIRQDNLALEPPASTFAGTIPAYGQLAIAPAPADSRPIRIRIRSLSSNEPLWAFASVTNNESGEVTLVTPWW